MPYLLTIFFFIWINNIFGLIPILNGANLSGNIAFTFTLGAFHFYYYNIQWKQKLLETHFLDARSTSTNENIFNAN